MQLAMGIGVACCALQLYYLRPEDAVVSDADKANGSSGVGQALLHTAPGKM
jgi:hypothetical protein